MTKNQVAGKRTYCLLATLAASGLSVRAVVVAALLLLVVVVVVGEDEGERWVSLAVVVTEVGTVRPEV